MTQHLDALATAQTRRLQIAELRHAVRRDPRLLIDWMHDPPDELRDIPLLDVVRWTRASRTRGSVGVVELNGKAVRSGVNLMMPLGRASERSREWVAEHGTHYARRRRRDAA